MGGLLVISSSRVKAGAAKSHAYINGFCEAPRPLRDMKQCV